MIKTKSKHKFHFKMLSAFSILMIIIAALVIISWFLKWSGVSTKVNNQNTNIEAMGIFDIFWAPIKGFIGKADILIFILILGSFITIVVSSKALEGFSQGITRKMKGKEIWAIIPLMTFFSICGTTEGMAEESLGFYLICIPLMIAAGFDKWVGFLIVMLGAGVGVLASTVNPFLIGVAINGIKDIKTSVGDGLVWRIVSWLVLTTISITFVIIYAYKIKRNPQKSCFFKTLEEDKKFFLSEKIEKIEMNGRRKTTIIIFFLVLTFMICYLVNWDAIFKTDIMERFGKNVIINFPYLTGKADGFGHGGLDIVAAMFLIGSIVLGIVNGLGEDKFIKEFLLGASDILSVCLIIATAAGVGFILTTSHMQELFVNGLANSVGNMGNSIVILMVLFIAFLPLSFLIPSTSGFATAVIPLLQGVMAKDPNVLTSGIITAFSFACGILNLFTPTSGVVMGAISIAKIDYGQYLKNMWKIILILTLASFALLLIGGAISGIKGAENIA
ncbi:YfcC family protein [Spiroplasma endosymbiont of Crioceris asparagi]|uniref:YfcC family protein n=1 Tax=Spiroplasma endosymbiont of Crioceris asparagi TaxID=3066286 RepID=UPI0030D24B6E